MSTGPFLDGTHESRNPYDWLGSNSYFGENNMHRALEYANFLKHNPGRAKEKIERPAVLGAVIDLGYCCNLLDQKYTNLVKLAYNHYLKITPENQRAINSGGQDLLRRNH